MSPRCPVVLPNNPDFKKTGLFKKTGFKFKKIRDFYTIKNLPGNRRLMKFDNQNR